MSLAFVAWKRSLLDSAGSAGSHISQLGDHVLELFWQDGCEPTMSAMLDYAQAGLCGHYSIRAAEGRNILQRDDPAPKALNHP